MGFLRTNGSFTVIVVGLFFITFSCAAFANDLESRVKARWLAMSQHDFSTAHEFKTPAYRAVFTKNLYVHSFSKDILWNLTKIEGIKYDSTANLATVDVVVETTRNSVGLAAKPDVVSIQVKEKWLHIDNQWWHSSNE